MDVYDSPYRDPPAEGVGFLGKALALIALGAVLAEAWRSVRGTHERRRSSDELDAQDTVPAWEGDAVGSDLTGSGADLGRGAAVGPSASTSTARGASGGRGDDFGGPDLTPTGVIPTTHH